MSTPTRRRWSTAVTGARVIGGIYRDRVTSVYAARVRKDLVAQLGLPAYQADPYPLYDRIRALGPLTETAQGNLISATHAVCSEVDRRREAPDERVLLAPAMRGLGERDRRLVFLRFYEQCTQREIGVELGLTQTQVSRLLERVLRDLRLAVGDDGFEAVTARTA